MILQIQILAASFIFALILLYLKYKIETTIDNIKFRRQLKLMHQRHLQERELIMRRAMIISTIVIANHIINNSKKHEKI